jgi:Ser/Thr protein kinase RdoA (MazF antagonist)
MLTKQYLTAEILREIIDRFDLGEVKKIEPLTTSGNISYIIKASDQPYFLRLCPAGPRWRSQKEILAELELLAY